MAQPEGPEVVDAVGLVGVIVRVEHRVDPIDAGYDTGPILAQQEVLIGSEDTAEDIERRVMAVEPGLFVETLRGLAEGTFTLPDPGS